MEKHIAVSVVPSNFFVIKVHTQVGLKVMQYAFLYL